MVSLTDADYIIEVIHTWVIPAPEVEQVSYNMWMPQLIMLINTK